MTIEELRDEFEIQMMKIQPGLFLDKLPNGEYKHPDVYDRWVLYKTMAKLFLGITED